MNKRTPALEKQHTLLYVDDEPENLTGFKFLFRRHYNILLAHSAEEALEIMKAQDVHLLLADHRMPKVTGSALLANVAEIYPDIVRIIVTGYSDIEGIIEAVNKGRIYYYVTKPWNADELKVIIDRALEAYQLKLDNRHLIKNLTETNKELDTFLYHSSHDLRRPITTIMGLTQVARLSLKDADSLNLFDKIEDTAIGMNKMLQKLYMVADAYAHEESVVERVNFEELMAGVFADLAPLAQEKKVDLQFSASDQEVIVHSSPLLLRNVLLNLVENSIIFKSGLPIKAFVQVSVWTTPHFLNIQVADNGRGIASKYLPKIYNMYFVASEDTLGNGLGLYVVKKSIDMLKGHIQLETQVDQGSTFTLTMPL